MFDIAWSEMIVIGAVALMVIPPKDLPKALRAVGAMTAKARRMAVEFQDHFREAMREAELESVKQEVASLNQDLSAMSSSIQSEVDALGSELPSGQPAVTSQAQASKVESAPTDGPAADTTAAESASATPKPATAATLSVEASPTGVTVTETAAPGAKPKPARKKRTTAKAKPVVAAEAGLTPANGSRKASTRPKAPRKRAAKTLPSSKPSTGTSQTMPPGDDRAG